MVYPNLETILNPLPTPGISARAQSISRHLPVAAVGLR